MSEDAQSGQALTRSASPRVRARALIGLGHALVPGALVVFLSFHAGGFFPGAVGIATFVLALLLVLQVWFGRDALTGLRGRSGLAAVALALFAAWALLSSGWSHAPGRAAIEFDRAALYLLAVLTFACLPRDERRLARMLGGVAIAAVVVCTIGLTTRVAADVWPIGPNVGGGRLSYPITYWNALGLLAAIGVVACVHFASDARGPRWARIAGAAATVPLVATLVLTYSRGAVAVLIVGLLAYAVLARPAGLPAALFAAGPACAVVAIAVYHAGRLAEPSFDAPAAVTEGHKLALIIAAAVVGAALLRAALVPLDRWFVNRERLSLSARRRLGAGALVIAFGLAAAAVAAGAPGEIGSAWDDFVEGKPLPSSNTQVRSRLTDPSNNGRIDYWKVSLDAFRDHPLRGHGAGTFQLLWARERPIPVAVVDAHTLYGETLGELGVVGAALLGVFLLALLGGAAARVRGPERSVLAAVVAIAFMWALHAGVDWDWELPAITLPVLALVAGASATARAAPARRLRLPLRVAVVVGVVGLAATPVLAAISQARLDDSVAALKAGRCGDSIASGQNSLDALGFRPEPWEVIGYCESRLGRHKQAIGALTLAVENDPESWELRYGRALVRGAAGVDPRVDAAEARRLNPRAERTIKASREFSTSDPARWRLVARRTPLPIP